VAAQQTDRAHPHHGQHGLSRLCLS